MSSVTIGSYPVLGAINANPIVSLRGDEAIPLAPDAVYQFADGTTMPQAPTSNNTGVAKYFAASASVSKSGAPTVFDTTLPVFIKRWNSVSTDQWLAMAIKYEGQAFEKLLSIGEKLDLLTLAENAYAKAGDLGKALEMALERGIVHYENDPEGIDRSAHNARGLAILRAAELCGKLEAQGGTYKDYTEKGLLISAIKELELGFPNARDDVLLNAKVRLARLNDPANADQRERDVLWSFVRKFDGLNYLTFMADAFTRLYDILETELSGADQAGDRGLIQMREAEMSRVRSYAKVIDGRFQEVYHVSDFAGFLETNVNFLSEKKNIDPSDTYLKALKYFRRFVADEVVTDREVALLRSAIDVNIKAAADKLAEGVPMMEKPEERYKAEALLKEAQGYYEKILTIIGDEIKLARLKGSKDEIALLNNAIEFSESIAMIRLMLNDKDGAARSLERAAEYASIYREDGVSERDNDLASKLLLGTFGEKMNAMVGVLVERAAVLEKSGKLMESAKLRFAIAKASEHAGNHEMAGFQYLLAHRGLINAGNYFLASVVSDHIMAVSKKSGAKHAYSTFVDAIRKRRRVANRRFGLFFKNTVKVANDWTIPNMLNVMAEAIVTPQFRARYFQKKNWIPAELLNDAIAEIAQAQQLGNRDALNMNVPGLPSTLEI